VVCSDVRFRIDRLFREAGISIAYPQRDIHLDTLSPIQVSLVEPGHAGRDVTDRPHLP
jgi:potassium efflux system protein